MDDAFFFSIPSARNPKPQTRTRSPKLETPSRQFIRHGSQVGFEGEVGLGLEQGEIQIFGEALQAMENPQRTAAIERGMFVERRAPESKQGNLLHDLANGILIVWRRPGLVAVDQTGERGMDHGVVGFFWK